VIESPDQSQVERRRQARPVRVAGNDSFPIQVVCVAINVGLDIGSGGLKLAAIGSADDLPQLEALCSSGQGFRLVRGTGDPVVISEYHRIVGSPIQTTYNVLSAFHEVVPERFVEGIRVTGSGGRTIARILGIYFEHEFKATAHMVARFYPSTRTIFEIGGESSRYWRLEPADDGRELLVADYDSTGECAAGTGSFLEQQAARLGYAVQDIGEAVRSAPVAARVAGRCSVFAKSDMIHAQQKGFSPPEILRGLCRAVAQNFKSGIVKGRAVNGPVLLVGGVSNNAGVVQAMREVFELDEHQLVVPELNDWCGAIGVAMLEASGTRKRSYCEIHRLNQHATQASALGAAPLTLARVNRLPESPRNHDTVPGAGPVSAFLGVDIGSVSTNLVVIDDGGHVIFDSYLRTGGKPLEAVQTGMTELSATWGDRLRICGVGATGSGRELVAEFIGADVVRDEITAHKTGALFVSRGQGGVLVDTIFEIGGQDSKFIALENGVVVDFTMNEACAAGTGSFLEEQADKLGVNIKSEFARLALASHSPARLGERCTVFMEREVTSALHSGATIPDLLAALAYSIAMNYLNRVVRGRHIGEQIYFQGGTAYNDAVAAAFSEILGKTVTVPPYNGVMGAMGMALIAQNWSHQQAATGATTRFRGYEISGLRQEARTFVCHACSNECDIKEFNVEGNKSYWGDKCSDRFRKPLTDVCRPVIDDLFEYRDQVVKQIVAATPAGDKESGTATLSVGIPTAMSTLERYPFWHTYFAAIGVQPVASPPTDQKIAAAGVESTVASPCYPVQVVHGHVRWLFDRGVDYVFLPNMLDNETHEDSPCVAHFCPWTQTLPWVVRSAPDIEANAARILAPTLHFQLGPEQVKDALAEVAQRLGARRQVSDAAVDAAYAAQRQYQERLIEAGQRAIRALEHAGAPGVVLLGRPYNIYDRNVTCDVARKLRRRYGTNVIPIDFLATGKEAVHDLQDNMFWSSGQRILEAARIVASHERLHAIFLSNFKCGPDSYIKHFAHDAMKTPILVLQFDGHGNDAGYLTRCEAFLDSKGILRWNSDQDVAPAPAELDPLTH
jgi:predicted CoA-substrate-specific enzyme activase